MRYIAIHRRLDNTEHGGQAFYSKYASAHTLKELHDTICDEIIEEGDEVVFIDTEIQGAAAVIGYYIIEPKFSFRKRDKQ